MFVLPRLNTVRSLRMTIPRKRWALIRSLEIHETWRVLSGAVGIQDARYAAIERFPRGDDVWESECRAIKRLTALQRFVLVLANMDFLEKPDALLRMLEPLKDLRLKDQWELKFSFCVVNINEIDAVLKARGFHCIVSYFATFC